jgi:purine-cytosine permease-like protein
VFLAIYGHDWLHKVFHWLFWASLPFWLGLIIGVITGRVATTASDAGAFSVAGFVGMFAVAASYNITYAPYVSDYSRYLPKETPQSKIIGSVFFGASGAPILLMPLGAWLAIHLGVADALVGIHDAGNEVVGNLGTILSLLAVGALVATMGMNAYSGMLSVVTAVDSYRPVAAGSKARVSTILGLAVVWLVVGVAMANALSVVNNSLIVMLYLLSPWTAINLVDFYFVRHGKYAITDLFTPTGIYGRWGRRGVVTYVVGIVIEIPFMFIPGWYESWGAVKLQYVDISWVLGLAVSGGLYWYLTRSLDLAAEAPAIAASNSKLEQSGSAR